MTYSVKHGYTQSAAPSNQEEAPLESVFDSLPKLDFWEMLLLFNMELLCEEDELWTALSTQACYIATDGSAPDGKGSFAWIISDIHGTILAKCNGPVFGAGVTSFRAEGYGILSLLRFLLRLRQVHHPPLPPAEQTNPQEADDTQEPRDSLQERILQHTSLPAPHIPADPHQAPMLQHSLVCDNKSMVNKINRIGKHATIFPNNKMASEWDFLAEIRLAMQQLGDSQPTLSHIKGHQDSKRPLEELPLQAQLNCKADKLADQYLKDFPDIDRSKVPLLPTAGCQLHLAKGTITHNLKLDLTHARSVPPLKSKLCHKHAWLQHEFNEIDWTSHGLALKRLAKHRKTLTQYLHDWLPVGKRVHMYDTKYTSWPVGAIPTALMIIRWWKTQSTFASVQPPAGWSGGPHPSATCPSY
jgi:hypothetical protein